MRQTTNIRPIVSALCLMILFGMNLAPAAAANITVNSGMNNSNIQNVINNANAGDTINFNGGNYQNVSLVINKKLNVVTTKNSVLNGNDSNGKTTFVFYFTNKSSGTVLSGFNINTNTDYAIILSNVKNLNITNNRINGGNVGSIYVKGSTNVNLTKNTVSNSGGNGVTIVSSNTVNLYKNIIKNNQNDGVNIQNSQNTNLTMNKVLENGFNGIKLRSSKNTIVNNNSINNNNGEGILLYDTINTNITGNNITYNILNGILFEDLTTNTYVSYNYFIHDLNGIYLDSVSYGDVIVSNYISKSQYTSSTSYNAFYTGNGIKVGDNYQDTSLRAMIYYNTILGNEHFSIEGDANYDKFIVGPNFYGTNDKWSCEVCPMIKTGMLNSKIVWTKTGIEIDIYDPLTNQVAPTAKTNVTVVISKKNRDGSIISSYTTKGQIVNGKLILKTKLDKNSYYTATATYDDGNSVSSDFKTSSTDSTGDNGQSGNNGNSKSNGDNTTAGQTPGNGTGSGGGGSGPSNSNVTQTGSGKDLTQIGLEGASANKGGQQSAGDKSGGNMNGVEVAVKNAINKEVQNPFNNLGIIALLGLIGIGYFKRDKFK